MFIVVVNSHQRWKQTRNRVCFHLWCELTTTMNVTEWQVSWNSRKPSEKGIKAPERQTCGYRMGAQTGCELMPSSPTPPCFEKEGKSDDLSMISVPKHDPIHLCRVPRNYWLKYLASNVDQFMSVHPMLETQALLFQAFKNSSTNVTGEGKANITGGDNRDPKPNET